jgi:glucosamine-6-phosphate deaminase
MSPDSPPPAPPASPPPPEGAAEAGEQRIPTRVFDDAAQASLTAAREIAGLIRRHADQGRPCVLGLATGSTPLSVYEELVRMHRQEALSFRNVVTFNLDEYYPMRREELQSYWRFMHENLFDLIDIRAENVHLPDGRVPESQVAEQCAQYERMIAGAGGIDLQLLGIGRTGHIGFNEPGSPRHSRTRLIHLDRVTRIDAASDFFGEENVPRRALTMGVGTILEARRVLLIAFGENKAAVIARAVEGPVTPGVAASYLQQHPNAQFLLDRAAAAELTAVKAPWLRERVAWDAALIRKAAIWLARKLDKPVLKLTDEDYNESGLQDLLADHGPAYQINLDVFRALQDTITGWPGGKPQPARRPGDRHREADDIFPKRIVVLSPHPDDDVISMGGTLIRLIEHGHEVHTAYQTSGHIAVFDAEAIRFADFATDFNRLFGVDTRRTAQLDKHIEQSLRNKKPGQIDSPEVQQIKGLIRKGEARAACRYCGVPVERVHFLDMPFYETGTVRKKPLSEPDIQLVADLLIKVKPHQIYAAGDLSDPHGTHRVCLAALGAALDRCRKLAWFARCQVWLYRGAWQEWEPYEIEMAVPLSPQELTRKRYAIFKHQSQKDKALFPGHDQREFWQRAEHRNRATAALYDKLGLAEYEAIEGFVRWQPAAPGAAPPGRPTQTLT